ncbi:LOW QUALITY PROTEIN: beta-1,3-galactosyltransferase 5-like, partial [Rhinophrynus dorsalis]
GIMRHCFFKLIGSSFIMTSAFFITSKFLGPGIVRYQSEERDVYLLDGTPITSAPPTPIRESVTLTDGIYNYPLNFSQFQFEFPYLQSYRCSLILTPREEPEEAASKKLLILAIKSHPSSGVRREALRRTWAQEGEMGGYRVRQIFLVAKTEVVGHMEIVKMENTVFGDILQWDFNEGHHNLSLKERCFLEWLHQHLPHVNFIFKGDDDEYVNPGAVVQYVKKHGSSPRMLNGHLRPHSGVMRYSKYAISETLIPFKKYPHFLSGGGFLYPGPSVKILYEVSQRIPVFPLDDVYFGFLALAGNLTYRDDRRFHVSGLKYDACKYQEALVVHGIGPEHLVQMWEEVQNATCKEGNVGAR